MVTQNKNQETPVPPHSLPKPWSQAQAQTQTKKYIFPERNVYGEHSSSQATHGGAAPVPTCQKPWKESLREDTH
jgi:hypothetical protein